MDFEHIKYLNIQQRIEKTGENVNRHNLPFNDRIFNMRKKRHACEMIQV